MAQLQSHEVAKFTDRTNIDKFPEEFRLQVLAAREAQQLLDMGVVNKFAEYREGLVEDSGCVTAIRYSNSKKFSLLNVYKPPMTSKSPPNLLTSIASTHKRKVLPKPVLSVICQPCPRF